MTKLKSRPFKMEAEAVKQKNTLICTFFCGQGHPKDIEGAVKENKQKKKCG
jgi:hypothetical protein